MSGKVSNINKAFAVELAPYEVERRPQEDRKRGEGNEKRRKQEREVYRGYEGDVHLPADVLPVIEGVFGLDTRRMAHRAIVPFPTITPLTPPQVAQLYDFPKPPHHIGKETIGLLEFSDPVIGTCGYLPGDIHAYFTTSRGIGPGFVTPTLTDIDVNGASNSPGGPDDAEVALDIEVAGAVAQGAPIAVYFTTWDENGWILALKRAVHPNPGEPRPSVLSISWAWTEFFAAGNITWNPATMSAVSTAFQEAAMFGVTVLAASGDDGSDCQIGDGNAHVYYPESDPWGTSCGGTTIGNVAGSSFAEVTWNDNGITGGGISDFFDLPHWQRHHHIPLSINPGNRKGRGVPDIAGYANGYQIVLGGLSSGPRWGTSETAPLYAGLIAIINAHLGERAGYLQQDILETFVDRGQFRQLNQPTVLPNGKRIPGLRPDHPRQIALMEVLVRFSHLVAGGTFTTRELHPETLKALGATPETYKLSSLRYDLSKLRAKGLVEKLPHSHRYRLLARGYQICLVYLKLFHRIYAPLTAAILDPFPNDRVVSIDKMTNLDRLYTAVGKALDNLCEAIGLKAA